MNIKREPFGTTQNGKAVDIITIENSSGYSIQLLTYGAFLHSFRMPDRNGNVDEVTKNFPTLSEYEKPGIYHGATIGRYANRIAKSQFFIDEIVYNLEPTNDACQLHGGPGGFHTKIWEAFPMKYNDRCVVKFTLSSPDGDQGFPGNLDVALSVTLTEKNELMFYYEAVSDKNTYISLTNHTYWNLSGFNTSDGIYNQLIRIPADTYVEVDKTLVPTGKLIPVDNTAFDVREAKEIGSIINQPELGIGFDNNFVLAPHTQLSLAAQVVDQKSGRCMDVLTTAPSVQFYTDNFSNPPHKALCLETGELPDAMNHSNFPSPLLKPGEMYRHLTVHSFYNC